VVKIRRHSVMTTVAPEVTANFSFNSDALQKLVQRRKWGLSTRTPTT